MTDDRFKHWYSFAVLFLTVAWAVFTVWITFKAIATLDVAEVVTASGANLLMGALIVWNGNINQFYFRKRPSQKGETKE